MRDTVTAALHIQQIAPGASLQDGGRPGLVHQGVSPAGAADRRALLEAAALLESPTLPTALEMPGAGGTFCATAPLRIALTGAPMVAALDGQALAWNATHLLPAGAQLRIGGVTAGTYGYLSCGAPLRAVTLGDGTALPRWQNSFATHFAAGIGGALNAGSQLDFDVDPDCNSPARCLPLDDRFDGGLCRVMPGPQTALFSEATRARFFDTGFCKARRANRQGAALDHDDDGFSSAAAEGLLSDFITAGDIQLTGAGDPFVLLAECQTIGGYPRIGTVLPEDLPRVAQCPPGRPLRFQQISLEEARHQQTTEAQALAGLRKETRLLIRNPEDIRDLLSYQLISGVTGGDDLDRP